MGHDRAGNTATIRLRQATIRPACAQGKRLARESLAVVGDFVAIRMGLS